MIGRACFFAIATLAAPAVAQDAPIVARHEVSAADQGNARVLPANTRISMTLNDPITTKGQRWHEGDTFNLTVSRAVRLSNYIVIPRGARGVGRITWMTSKGMFGKSGKMEFDIEYVEIGDRRIPLVGHFRQEGEGNTVATIGSVVAVGVLGGIVTGKSASVPEGRELVAYTKEDTPVVFDGPPPEALVRSGELVAEPIPAVPASSSAGGRRANPDYPQTPPAPGLNPRSRVRCVTCR